MNDELIMNNYLLLLKSTTEVYVHGTLESSNECVRKVLKSSLNDTLDSQNKTYNLMVENGWYKVVNVKEKEIEKTLNSLCNDD